MLIWSSQTVKEPIVIMFEVMGIYACLAMRSGGFSVRHLLLFSASVMLLATLGFYAAYITGAVAVLSLIIPRRGGGRSSVVVGAVSFAVVTLLLWQTGAMTRHGETFERYTSLENVDQYRAVVGKTANTGFDSGFDTQSAGGFLAVASTGWIFLLLAPFPWQFSGASSRMLLTLPEQLLWWPLFFAQVVPGAREAVKRRLADVLPMILFILTLGLVYSLRSGNVGLIHRQRAQLLPYLLILAEFRPGRRRGGPGPVWNLHAPERLPERGGLGAP